MRRDWLKAYRAIIVMRSLSLLCLINTGVVVALALRGGGPVPPLFLLVVVTTILTPGLTLSHCQVEGEKG